MTALVADRNTPVRANADFGFPVLAATKLFAGSLVCLNAAGFATKGAVATTLKAVGVAQENVDNTNGASGDIKVRVKRGLHRLANSAAADLIAMTEVGTLCYIVDDQTVAKTNGGATRSAAGTVRDVDADGVWVEI